MITATETLKGMLSMATHFYISDLKASTAEQMTSKPGGAHRCPYDFTYELVKLNALMAARLRGETPPEGGGDGYITAPAEFCDVETAAAGLQCSVDGVMAALDALDDAGLQETFDMWGRTWTKMQLATLCGLHMMYHDGQLNYVQTAGGDLAVHWGG
jgi:hypothetical protein